MDSATLTAIYNYVHLQLAFHTPPEELRDYPSRYRVIYARGPEMGVNSVFKQFLLRNGIPLTVCQSLRAAEFELSADRFQIDIQVISE